MSNCPRCVDIDGAMTRAPGNLHLCCELCGARFAKAPFYAGKQHRYTTQQRAVDPEVAAAYRLVGIYEAARMFPDEVRMDRHAQLTTDGPVPKPNEWGL